jgi:hypothetical protein
LISLLSFALAAPATSAPAINSAASAAPNLNPSLKACVPLVPPNYWRS